MPFARALTALAQLEEKLRRQLGLAGEVGATFQPQLTPVIIAGDLRDAGNAANQGRWFRWTFGNGGAFGNAYQSLRFEQDSLVTALDFCWAQPGETQCYLTARDQASAVAPVTLAGTWTDRKMIAGDQAPLTQGVLGVLTGTDGSPQNRIFSFNPGAGNVVIPAMPVHIMMPAGSSLNWRFQGGSAFYIGVEGRIWP